MEQGQVLPQFSVVSCKEVYLNCPEKNLCLALYHQIYSDYLQLLRLWLYLLPRVKGAKQ